ncbi:MAG: hypothetical protein ACLFQV_00065 [Vulcanimicrobiota bacterium]
MKFASIGQKLDNFIGKSTQTWRGSQAKKTIDNVMEKAKNAAGEAKDSVSISTTEARSNLKQNMATIKQEEPGFLKRAWNVGMSGGLVGMARKSPEEFKAQKSSSLPPPPHAKAATPPPLPAEKQVEQVEGWNIAQ